MLEIKFKAWDIKNKCWLTDKESVYLSEEGEAFILARGAASDYLSRVYVEIVFYTGLKDKNGVEVYDEYFVKAGTNIYHIVWLENNFQPLFWSEELKEWMSLSYLLGYKNFEVIGNRFQNPELLNK
jgi:hypothetical protein